MSDDIKVPAIGFSTTINIDGNRQMVFQGYFEQDEDDVLVNARIDRIMRLADRQRSVYDIPVLKEERAKLLEEVAQYDEDVGTAEIEFQKSQAALDVQILELRNQADNFTKQGYDEHVKRGGVGAYKPKGRAASNLTLMDTQVEQIKATKEANAAERKQFQDTVGVAVKRRQDRLKVLEEKIADLEKVLT
jgi:hypothetical protein